MLDNLQSATTAKVVQEMPQILRYALVIPQAEPRKTEERNDLFAFKTSLSIAGIRFDEVSPVQVEAGKLQGYNIIIIPHPSALDMNLKQRSAVTKAVGLGARIVLDGPSVLANDIGIVLGKKPIQASQVSDLRFPGITLYWTKHAPVLWIPLSKESLVKPLCIEKKLKKVLAVRGGYGHGKYVYFSFLFDPDTDKGYTRYPFLIETLCAEFGYKPVAERRIAEMYFDPGNRTGVSIEKLVKFWHEHGVHKIFAGAWYGAGYDYGKLVRLCHENGILVYCWLEFPDVGNEFWAAHPEWREKTALLADAHVDWRHLMNLADPQCRNEVFRQTAELLKACDWDGVDLAELYFESTNGPSEPESFTPMNDIVRRDFKRLHNFDPVEIMHRGSPYYWEKNPRAWIMFSEYRKTLCNHLKEMAINFLSEIRAQKKSFEIIITAIDASMVPSLETNIAEDTKYLLHLQKKYKLTLQAEDEWMLWPGKPERYEVLGAYYRKFVRPTSALAIDFNVVKNHPRGIGGLPSEKPAGEEVRQVAYNIDISHARPVFYAEDSLYPFDFKNIAMVLARDTEITPVGRNQWKVNTPYTVTLNCDTKREVFLDGNTWRAGENAEIIIPAGVHYLRFGSKLDEPEASPRLRFISSELRNASFTDKGITFSYTEETTSCYALINFRPLSISIDNRPAECPLLISGAGASVKLPAGNHKVVMLKGRQ